MSNESKDTNFNNNMAGSMIIMNPSKNFKEVYTQSLIEKPSEGLKDQKEGNIFKRFILYAGSKIFINNKSEFDR